MRQSRSKRKSRGTNPDTQKRALNVGVNNGIFYPLLLIN
jgi:hypothetical protein